MSKSSNYKPRPNYLWSILSVAAVLFMLAVFGFLTLQGQDLVKQMKSDFQLVLELTPEATDANRLEMEKQLKGQEGVIATSVTFVSKESGLETLSKDLGADILNMDMPNPLNDVIHFSLSAEHFSAAQMALIKTKYEQEAAVVGVYYQEGLIKEVLANVDRFSLFFLVAGGLLFLLALTLIHNTIRLAIWANRFLLKNMELVGASWGFIRAPFLKTSLRNGLVSGLIATLALSGIGLLIWGSVPEVAEYFNPIYGLYIVGMVLVVGVLINLTSTWFVLTRFLRMGAQELHS